MLSIIIILAAALVFFVMSFFLFRGKGSWLIAGYNTAPESAKRRYDKEKLCRAAGAICLAAAVMLCFMAALGYLVDTGVLPESIMLWFGLVFAGVMLTVVITAVSYMNKRCLK